MFLLLRWFILSYFVSSMPGVMEVANLYQSQLADTSEILIETPVTGAAVQGVVPFSASVQIDGFFSYELVFQYHQDETETWFVISEGDSFEKSTVTAEWDTFSITDGTYDLKLIVYLKNGDLIETKVTEIRVRNYSPVETNTPTPPITPLVTLVPVPTLVVNASPTLLEIDMPTKTPAPADMQSNPAEFDIDDIIQVAARGAAGVLAVFIFLGIYTSFRRIRRK